MRNVFIKRNPYCVARYIKKKLYILNPEEKNLYILNKIAAYIWKLLWKTRTIDEIIKNLSQEFHVPVDEIKTDIQSFIKQGYRNNLFMPSVGS